MFKHFGRLLLELLKYASLSNDDKLAAVDWEGEERVRLAYAQGKGILFCTGHFGFWEQQALAHALKFEPMAVMARPLDNPKLHDLLERIRVSDGNPVLYRRGRGPEGAAPAGRRPGRGNSDRPAHDEPGRDLRGFFRQARGHHVHAGGAGHQDRRAGDSAVCLSAARRPVSHDLRAPGGAATRGFSGRHSRIHAALHRRAGNARQAPSRAVAVDASPLARHARRATPAACFPLPPRKVLTKQQRVIVVAPNWLGDAVMALPAIRDVRRHFADAHLVVAARPSVAMLFRAVPGVDEIVAPGGTISGDIGILFPNSFRPRGR